MFTAYYAAFAIYQNLFGIRGPPGVAKKKLRNILRVGSASVTVGDNKKTRTTKAI